MSYESCLPAIVILQGAARIGELEGDVGRICGNDVAGGVFDIFEIDGSLKFCQSSVSIANRCPTIGFNSFPLIRISSHCSRRPRKQRSCSLPLCLEPTRSPLHSPTLSSLSILAVTGRASDVPRAALMPSLGGRMRWPYRTRLNFQ